MYASWMCHVWEDGSCKESLESERVRVRALSLSRYSLHEPSMDVPTSSIRPW